MSLFSIIFDDDTFLEGGDYIEPKWKEIPIFKKIKTLIYSLPSGDCLIAVNFIKVYHFIEATVDLTGKSRGQKKIAFTHLIIEKKEHFVHYKIDVIYGNIIVEFLNKNDNFIKSLNPIGWRFGIGG